MNALPSRRTSSLRAVRSPRRGRPAQWLIACASLAAALVTLLVSTRAQAIPAFARRYQTSCQTCHLAFPKLTPFGEAFRRNAYRFPSGGDEVTEKEERIALGNDAQKDVFPRSVWPGQIPGTVPLSFIIDARGVIGPKPEMHGEEDAHAEEPAPAPGAPAAAAAEEEHGDTKITFKESMARLVAGGSLGGIGGYFGAVSFGGHAAAELERAFIVLTPIDQTSLHLKVGQFEPSLHGVSIHRGLLGHQLRLTSTRVRLNPHMYEPSLRGFEASGLVVGRVGWTAGVVENIDPAHGLTSDMYGRLEVKAGGMRWDGVDGQAESAAWRERSFSFGLSGYRGRSKVSETIAGTVTSINDTFVRAGADAHLVLNDLLVDVVVATQRHSGAEIPKATRTMDIAYAEITYVTFPWIFPTVRGEWSRVRGSGMEAEARWIGLVGINTVLRPNVVLRAEAAMGKDPGGHGAGFRFAALTASVAF
ncbi:MAG: hypothetical protein HYV09_05475 [Deltaproteobacteria bacterium]|nr:hypothetical protein [Deltaproteobacteria bacterium]